jgi:hypothetical protein
MFSELLDELIEDSPFLRQLHEEAVAEGRAEGRAEGLVSGLRTLVAELARLRFADITAEELAGVESMTDADRLQALALGLASAQDVDAARRALDEALA